MGGVDVVFRGGEVEGSLACVVLVRVLSEWAVVKAIHYSFQGGGEVFGGELTLGVDVHFLSEQEINELVALLQARSNHQGCPS